MYEVLVFAGTTEGYEIASFLAAHEIPSWVCVATEYGSRALEENPCLHICAGRLDRKQMGELMEEIQPKVVVDATHPYAAEVTENIKNACQDTGFAYLRLLREASSYQGQAVYVDSVEEAVSYLENTGGNILVTTGSKELSKFTALTDYKNRIYARVLSLPQVMEECAKLGFEGKNLIGMQGPFSRELNQAMIRQYDCSYLVTKDSGSAGGFQEKYEASIACGCIPVIIGRPGKEEGMSLYHCKRYLASCFGFTVKRQVVLAGVGMGDSQVMTEQVQKAFKKAQVIIGARRLADAGAVFGCEEICYEYDSEKIAEYIRNHPQYERAVVALSGDSGFYSGARKLIRLLEKMEEVEVTVLPGISSLSYFMAKIKKSWDDAYITSCHGKKENLVFLSACHKKVFTILGTKDGVGHLAEELTNYEMGQVMLWVGERLSYEDEKIQGRPAKEWIGYEGDALSVLCIENPHAVSFTSTHGLPDEVFIRGKAPMTKEEVRSVSLMKLQLQEDSVCYDIGAGTGSVAVEMALKVPKGRVYAIERKEEACQLICQNRMKFKTEHLKVVEGLAPEAMEDLEAPTHAFIGGSAGNLKEIVDLLLEKNPAVRIVINCITLETLGEAMEIIRREKFAKADVVQIQASRDKKVGGYHMMMGENPIYIITCQKEEAL